MPFTINNADSANNADNTDGAINNADNADNADNTAASAHGKYDSLLLRLASLKGAVLAFSGGVDSSFLLLAACDSGIDPLAVTARHPAVADFEIDMAKKVASELGARHVIIDLPVMDNVDFISNSPDRCFHCKRALIRSLSGLAARDGFTCVIDGTNADDPSDYRPGLKANDDSGIISPLREAGLTKDDIRRLSFEKGLTTWNFPSAPCLATRLPYGEPITVEALKMVDKAESILRNMGFTVLRVRKEKDTARIELPAVDIERAAGVALRGDITAMFREIGFLYVSLDLEGFQSGKMNRAIKGEQGN
ncbi:MAG: ATP-dependent sacrificial sulfur transferase LarE [Nitrospirae bacterium]|nr:ATP-dependent sacrificial sulfur transferase LarE [Nitrospirota bacterium]